MFSWCHHHLGLNSIEFITCLIAANGTSPTTVNQYSPWRLPMRVIAPCCKLPSVRLAESGSIKTEIAESPSENIICITSCAFGKLEAVPFALIDMGINRFISRVFLNPGGSNFTDHPELTLACTVKFSTRHCVTFGKLGLILDLSISPIEIWVNAICSMTSFFGLTVCALNNKPVVLSRQRRYP